MKLIRLTMFMYEKEIMYRQSILINPENILYVRTDEFEEQVTSRVCMTDGELIFCEETMTEIEEAICKRKD